MCLKNTLFVTASLVLTLTFLAVGISFFGPFWLSNIGRAVNETKYADPQYESYLPANKYIESYPDRGLWAQCGYTCIWFWTDGFRLQSHLLTPLEWHLAAQVLYTVAAVLILVSELTARVHVCCSKTRKTRNLASIGLMVLISALLQTGALVAFGIGASDEPYNAITDPSEYNEYLGQAFYDNDNLKSPYLGWCFWMAVVGDMTSVFCGTLFLLAAWCNCCYKESKTRH